MAGGDAMFEGWRVVELADEGSAVCGWVFAELGADVIAVEPPRGSVSRELGPFVDGVRGTERSLHWAAYARNKRSVVLDLEDAADREPLRALLDTADVFIESRAPGALSTLGLGWDAVAERNPALVYVSITPFGQTGPKASWAATDLTIWAAAGPLWLAGDDDRAPVRISVPQAWAHASAEAATAALVALHERNASGCGQHVDVSAQEACALATQVEIVSDALGEPPAERCAGGLRMGPFVVRFVYPALDGHVSITHVFGSTIGPASARLMAAVCEDGFCEEALRDVDWVGFTDRVLKGLEDLETFERAKAAIAQWTASKTKSDLFAIAQAKALLIAPVASPRDVVDNPHFTERRYFEPLSIAGRETRQPGPFARFSGVERREPRPAPRLGEHSDEVRAEIAAGETKPTPRAASAAGRTRPLEGVRVLDLMWALAGPVSTRVLADYGAEVIRVESTTHVDVCRTLRPFVDATPALEGSSVFHSCNLGKQTITLDLATPEARSVLLDLARRADVVTEAFTPGTLAKLGLSYETLREVKPDIIVLSTCLMGQSGPLAHFAGYGNLAAAVAGFYELTGWPDRAPAGPFGAYTDYVAPRFNAISILAALEHRHRTGEGQHIDMSQAESALHFLAPALLDVLVNDHVPTRRGNRDERFAPHGCYPTRGEDRWIALATRSETEWETLCAVLGKPDLTTDARFATRADRLTHADDLDAALDGLTISWSAEDLENELQARHVPAHRVADSASALRDPHLAARGHFVSLPTGDSRSMVETVRSRLSRTPGVPASTIPALGAANFAVLQDVLGYDDDRISELVIAGALG